MRYKLINPITTKYAKKTKIIMIEYSDMLSFSDIFPSTRIYWFNKSIITIDKSVPKIKEKR